MLPSWKNEGYADFIAKESSYNRTEGFKAICNIDINPQSSSYKYFEYKIFTEYLLEVRSIGLNKFLQNEFELNSLKEKIIENYCSF